MSASGAALFARFAFPPNQLGYCGPEEHEILYAFGAAASGVERDVQHLARAFEGAWPYLELLNDAAATDDPLAEAVVEAYWIGGRLLGRVDDARWGQHLVDRFQARSGRAIDHITHGVADGAVPNHAYHVFGVYPWVGLLREGRGGSAPARILDRCRIRWGTVASIDGDTATVESQTLEWDGAKLFLGAAVMETVQVGSNGLILAGFVRPGDRVAMHWDWICQRLSDRQLQNLMTVTATQLRVANRAMVAA